MTLIQSSQGLPIASEAAAPVMINEVSINDDTDPMRDRGQVRCYLYVADKIIFTTTMQIYSQLITAHAKKLCVPPPPPPSRACGWVSKHQIENTQRASSYADSELSGLLDSS